MDAGLWLSVASVVLTVLVLYGGLAGRFASSDTTTKGLRQDIEKKASQESLNSLERRVSNLETTIPALLERVESRVSQGLNVIEGKIDKEHDTWGTRTREQQFLLSRIAADVSAIQATMQAIQATQQDHGRRLTELEQRGRGDGRFHHARESDQRND